MYDVSRRGRAFFGLDIVCDRCLRNKHVPPSYENSSLMIFFNTKKEKRCHDNIRKYIFLDVKYSKGTVKISQFAVMHEEDI